MVAQAARTSAILSCVTILVVLWEDARRVSSCQHRIEFWDTVVFGNWATRLVTICSACVRIWTDLNRACSSSDGGRYTRLLAVVSVIPQCYLSREFRILAPTH